MNYENYSIKQHPSGQRPDEFLSAESWCWKDRCGTEMEDVEMDSMQLNQQTDQTTLPEKKRGLTGSTVKIIAIVSMLIDHIGAGILGRFVVTSGYLSVMTSGDMNAVMRWLAENGALYFTYSAMRMIGRLGFPIFCFLLVDLDVRSQILL